MTDDLHPNAEELQEELRELLDRDPEMGPSILAVELPDRPRGLLSTADREYLVGQREYEHPQSEANRKQDIRERIANAFQDFSILVSYLSEDEREKVFNDIGEDQYQDPLASIISFLYLGLDGDLGKLEKIIEDGIYTGANISKIGQWSGEIADVDTSINVERRPDRSEIIEKFEKGDTDQLTPAEIGILVRSGQLDADDLKELEDTSMPLPYLFENLLQSEEADIIDDPRE
ncbi:hypothetical protein C487_09454 [Natrinema pallidum DSM 3751]|uniref:Domain of unknown function domain-containing protein n=1 Tax=Natrinema pallidum DSM 3751 TaxID=1227495 RepID=L9YZ86_9EURY|nr:hypothetical protein [Natrinema pallidum]ELY78243.1 hypothetical protein C487_09454 [Natrinema pallidum DSM 3751]